MNPNTAKLKIPERGPLTNDASDISHSSPNKPSGCLHCARPTRAEFCCPGCQQVYHYIKNSGLSRYYSLRDQFADRTLDSPLKGEVWVSNTRTDLDANPFIWKQTTSSSTLAAYVPNLSCAACLWLIRNALGRIANVSSIDVNFDDKLVFVGVVHDQKQGSIQELDWTLQEVLKILMHLGYRSYPPSIKHSDSHRLSDRRTLVDLAVSGALFGNVMLLAAAVYLGRDPKSWAYSGEKLGWLMESQFRLFFDVSSAILSGISLVFVGRRFFINAWNSLKHRALHIDQPIALALSLTFTVSIYNLIIGSPLLYFDSVAGLIFLLLVARAASETLASRARRLSESAISSIPPSNIVTGEHYTAAPGDILLADGFVISGTGEVSEAALTGESNAILKKVGDHVLAGSQNLLASLTIEATADADKSYVQKIRKIISDATLTKPKIATATEIVLRWFLRGIYVATGLAILIWSGRDPSRIVEVVCAVLIVSCPCALALAVPLARSFALRRAWAAGVIIKSPDSMETIGKIDTLLIDKTGTLTTGNVMIHFPTREDLDSFSPLELQRIAFLSSHSRHPVSKACMNFISAHTASLDGKADAINTLVSHKEDSEIQGITEPPGLGVQGEGCKGSESFVVKIGRASFIDGRNDGSNLAGFSIKYSPSGLIKKANFTTLDPLRPDSKVMIQAWQKAGMEIHMISGDSTENVRSTAESLGISRWQGSMLPEEKQAYVANLVANGKVVAMIGDGINDAYALATAHVGIAVKGGADLALSSADMFLSREGLGIVDDMIEFSKYSQRTIRLVMAIGISYNVIAVSLALAGFLHPLSAALIMPLSSVSVIAIAYLRKGTKLWRSSTLSCPLPSSLQV